MHIMLSFIFPTTLSGVIRAEILKYEYRTETHEGLLERRWTAGPSPRECDSGGMKKDSEWPFQRTS